MYKQQCKNENIFNNPYRSFSLIIFLKRWALGLQIHILHLKYKEEQCRLSQYVSSKQQCGLNYGLTLSEEDSTGTDKKLDEQDCVAGDIQPEVEFQAYYIEV